MNQATNFRKGSDTIMGTTYLCKICDWNAIVAIECAIYADLGVVEVFAVDEDDIESLGAQKIKFY